MSYEEMQTVLNDIADALPDGIYNELNGGIILSPETKTHPDSHGGLVICGEYHYDPYGLGRYIVLYYGSLISSYTRQEQLVVKLKEVLYHELTHHIESLAGDKTLERQDIAELEAYKSRFE